MVPITIFRQVEGHESVLKVGLAEIIDQDFVYIKGTKDQHEWLIMRQKAGARGGVEKQRRISVAKASKDKQTLPSSFSSSSSSEELRKEYIYMHSESNSEGKEKTKTVNKEEIKSLVEDWGKTLTKFGIRKDPRLDEHNIARLVATHGVEKTRLALVGAGFESGSDKFDPKSHVAITRLLKPNVFDKFVNLGSQQTQDLEKDLEWKV